MDIRRVGSPILPRVGLCGVSIVRYLLIERFVLYYIMPFSGKIVSRGRLFTRNCLVLFTVVLALTIVGCGLWDSEEECFENPPIIYGGSENMKRAGDEYCRDQGYDRATVIESSYGKIVTLCCEKD